MSIMKKYIEAKGLLEEVEEHTKMIKPRGWIIGCNVRWGNCLNQDGSLKADNGPTHKQHPPTAAIDPNKVLGVASVIITQRGKQPRWS
jgi:hypothetical protein